MAEKKFTIVMIDDEVELCNMVSEFLSMEGHNVVCVNKPEEAMEAVRRARPDMVFLDILMPKISGLELLSQIKAFNKEIPVVMISALRDNSNYQEALDKGAADFLSKPFPLEQLKICILKHLVRKE